MFKIYERKALIFYSTTAVVADVAWTNFFCVTNVLLLIHKSQLFLAAVDFATGICLNFFSFLLVFKTDDVSVVDRIN